MRATESSFVSEELEMTPGELETVDIDLEVDGDDDFSDDDGEL